MRHGLQRIGPDEFAFLVSNREHGARRRAHHAAHTLKGLGATFGATTMARLCQRAESHSAEPGPDMTPLVSEIAAEHERVTLALRRLE